MSTPATTEVHTESTYDIAAFWRGERLPDYRLTARVEELHSDIQNYLRHPPARTKSADFITGSHDPRSLPASETLLDIARELDALGGAVAGGQVTERMLAPLAPTYRPLAREQFRSREAGQVSAPEGTSTLAIRRAVIVFALGTRGDLSDALMSPLVASLEGRLAAWVRGDEAEDDEEKVSG